MIRSESTKCLPWPAARSAVGAARAPVAAAAALTAVALAVLGAGPAVAAVRARPQALASVAAAPAKVKYYIVPAPAHGSVPTLYSIAAATLGDGSLFMEIFKLNKGRPQPGGQRLESPHSVEPGWILLLPPGASGPGVRFGPLPATAKATSRVVHQHPARAQAAASGGSAAAGGAYGSGTIVETVIGGALLVFAAAGLGLVLRRRRRSGGGGRRRPARATQAGPGGDWVRGLATDLPGDAAPGGVAPGAAGPGWPDTGYPSWPANAPGHTLTPDHPSWPASDIGRPVGAAQRGRPGGDSPDWPYPDHPSWPANAPGHTLTPDHPSWPASDIGRPVGATTGYGQTGDAGGPGWPYPDHPSWPAGGPDHPVGGDDYPSWPAADPGGGRAGPGVPQARPGGPPPASPSPLNGGAGLPQRERLEAAPAPAVHHDPGSRQLAPQVPPARGRHVRVPAGYSGSADDTSQRWSAQLARTTGPIPQTYYDLAFPDGRLQVVLTEAPGADQGWAAPGSTSMLQLTTGADTGQQNAVAWQGADPGSADSVRLAQRILADADQQAAEIRLEASAQAAAIRDAAEREAAQIREQTAAEAAPIREGAEREAAEIREQAAAQAAAIREAAEQEAAELRAHLMAMSAELARVAAYVTENLASPPPGIKTIAVPVLEPAAEPVARPAARPSTAPRRPATRPGTRPAAKPAGKPKTRQLKAMRKIAAAAAVLVLFVAVSGATEIGLHGFKFFVFRSAGTGATNGNSLQENQGPGQPDAPGTHHPKAHATGQHHQKAQAHGKRQHGAKANHGKSARHSAQKK